VVRRVVAAERRVRACYGASNVVVYQAYSTEIAYPALAAGTFVSPLHDRTSQAGRSVE
jgi:hypothetical protein